MIWSCRSALRRARPVRGLRRVRPELRAAIRAFGHFDDLSTWSGISIGALEALAGNEDVVISLSDTLALRLQLLAVLVFGRRVPAVFEDERREAV